MIVIVGGGVTGLAALALLPSALLVTRPTWAWHAEPGRIWVEDTAGVRAEPFTTLLLCADEPLLLAALGCSFDGDRPIVDDLGATTVHRVFAAGRVTGADTIAAAQAQARAAAAAILADHKPADALAPSSRSVERLDPVGLAGLLEQPPGPARNRAVLAQCAVLGPVLPARRVGLAALAALTPDPPVPRPVQQDGAT